MKESRVRAAQMVEDLQGWLGMDDRELGHQLGVTDLSVWRWRTLRTHPISKSLEKLEALWKANNKGEPSDR